jgi:type VI secretion system secreted protein Hcp
MAMAIDAYMFFQGYDNEYLKSESQIDTNKIAPSDKNWAKFGFDKAKDAPGIFEVEDFSFDVEQTLNIGSQSTGSGAGRITFNPFSITRKIDQSSPEFFARACSGTPFKQVCLGARKAGGSGVTGLMYLVFMFKLVAVKTISWSYDDEAPKETVTFEYGGLIVNYNQQKPDGTLSGTPIVGGWNRVKNVRDDDEKKLIT